MYNERKDTRRTLDYVFWSEKVEKPNNYHNDPVLYIIEVCDEESKKLRMKVVNIEI